MTALAKKKALNTLKNNDFLLMKLLLECWNAETPHFGGCGPHRYDNNSKYCGYCNRPKDWAKVNASYSANEILEGAK
jgi:hypothetical protein